MSSDEELYLVNEQTGSRLRIDGCRRAPETNAFPAYGSSRICSNAEHRFPPSVDLRTLMTPVEHQLELNSCVGNALAGAYEFLIQRNSGKHIDVSRLFIYYNSRIKDGLNESDMEDQGTFIPNAIAALEEFGCCKEEEYPYQMSSVNSRPPDHCYEKAKNYRISEAMHLSSDLNEMKCCLADGYPFAFGIDVFSTFSDAETNGGFISMPTLEQQQSGQSHGAHAMLAVGFLDEKQLFIIRNSYGEKWGEHGYGYISYDYMTNEDICFNRHVIKSITNDQKPSNDDYWNPVQYDPTIDYSSECLNKTNDQYVDKTAFWHNEEYLNNLHEEYVTDPSEYSIYFGSSSLAKKTINEIKKKGFIEKSSKHQRKSQRFVILWIDRKTEENRQLAKSFEEKSHVKIHFCETYSNGEKYLLEKKKEIQSTYQFIIICRGYFPDEKKNPLNLLEFLDQHDLINCPTIVFTRDKIGLMEHLEKQAKHIQIHYWKHRLEITNENKDFTEKVFFYINK